MIVRAEKIERRIEQSCFLQSEKHGLGAVGSPEDTRAETFVRLTRFFFFVSQANFEPSLPATLEHTQHVARLRDLPARNRIEQAQQTFPASLLFRTCL